MGEPERKYFEVLPGLFIEVKGPLSREQRKALRARAFMEFKAVLSADGGLFSKRRTGRQPKRKRGAR